MKKRAKNGSESDDRPGTRSVAGEADGAFEIEGKDGFSRYRDPITEELAVLASTRDSVHRALQANLNRTHHKQGNPYTTAVLGAATESLKAIEVSIDKALVRTLRKHALYPWLKGIKGGPKGAHLARLIGTIGDPLRFPGRLCEQGHHVAEDSTGVCDRYVGEKGQTREEMTLCGAPVGPVRRGTGTRSVWHYCGLHVSEDGSFPKKRKGQKCSWNPIARGALLMPDAGIAAQMIRHKCEPYYAEVYLAKKEKLRLERGAERNGEIEDEFGAALQADYDAEHLTEIELRGGVAGRETEKHPESGRRRGLAAQDIEDADAWSESEVSRGIVTAGGEAGVEVESESCSGLLRPFQIDRIARKVMVKAFVGDMLQAWKAEART